MAEGLSLREFGRQIDVTGEAVRQAIADGRIPADCVGTRAVGKHGKTWPIITDPARAQAHWDKNRDPNLVRDKATLAAGAKRGWNQRRDEEPDEDRPAANGAAAPAGSAPALQSVADSKKETEKYKAMTARLDYEQRVGLLVDAEQVRIGFTNLVTAARTRLLGVPSKAKGRIHHLTVADVEILEGLIGEALEDLAGER